MNDEKQKTLQFIATITYCRYYSEDSSWGVYGFSTLDDIPYGEKHISDDMFYDTSNTSSKKDNKKTYSTLAGKMQPLVIGGTYTVQATYKFNKSYGHQYVPTLIVADLPKTAKEQSVFLSSLISEHLTQNLLTAYPNIVNDIVTGDVECIDFDKVKGMGQKTWDKLKSTVIDNYLMSDIIIMLKPLGVTFNMIKKLLDNEHNPVLLKQKLLDNPYILTSIDGIGFKKCDELALKIKPELLKSTERLVSYIKYYLTETATQNGHTWVSKKALASNVSNIVPECYDQLDYVLENNNFLYISGNKIGLDNYHKIEMEIYNILSEKIKKSDSIKLSDESIDKAIKMAEDELGFQYLPEQIDIIKKVLHSNVSFITGKAGCGKTSIMRAIILAYKNNHYNITASALSAMAAQRITEATNYPAMTIHRTLGCIGSGKFTFNEDHKLITDVAFVDEGSMVNASLFLHWLKAIGNNTRIIISGDYKQLPPIGFGNIFSDLVHLFSDDVVTKLTKPMRQAEQSGILYDANLIRDNHNPITESPSPKIIHGKLQDMYYMFRTNKESLFNIAVKTFLASIQTDGLDNVVIAVPRKKGCLNSVQELNNVIQDKLLGDEPLEIKGVQTFKLGAKVMQTVNDYDHEVFNGDIGYITKIDNEKSADGKNKPFCIVTYKDTDGSNNFVKYYVADLRNLELAYAMTAHKLQGAGRKTVIGIIDSSHYQLLDNCMLYTLLTRAKQRCLLLAEPNAFLQCIRTSHNKRNTWLQLELQHKEV